MIVVKASDVKAEETKGAMLAQGTCFRQLFVDGKMTGGVLVMVPTLALFLPGLLAS